MHIVHTIADLRQHLGPYQHPVFVPTMGNLHDGHLALIRQAKTLGDITVASIFVNRLQFAPHEDFDSYPRTWENDCQQLQSTGCGLLFAPTEADLYPEPQRYTMQPASELANILEGQFRPGFFVGVCTVVLKLFSCVFAGKAVGTAVFGQKDYQQLRVIEDLVRQFALPINVVSSPTQRAADGLALSSRNGYLSAEQRAQAVQLYQALRALGAAVQAEPTRLAALEADAMQALRERGWQPDYLSVRRRADLLEPQVNAQGKLDAQPLVVLGAARLGSTRLIDNVEM